MKLTGFKQFVETMGGGSYLPSTWTNSEADPTNATPGHPNFLPSLDIVIGSDNVTVPEISTSGIVKFFNYKKDPIKIELDNKTIVLMTFDQYKRITGDLPIIPQYTKLDVTFQRHPKDLSPNTSMITRCHAKFVGPDYLKNTYRIVTK